jgi:hypothetical protein
MTEGNGNIARTGSASARPYGYRAGGGPQPANLGDILERVLDTGIVIAGDIRVNLLDIELLTIKLRLVIASVDTARQLGIDWWRTDPWLSSNSANSTDNGGDRELAEENRRLRDRLAAAEAGAASGAERREVEAPARKRAETDD